MDADHLESPSPGPAGAAAAPQAGAVMRRYGILAGVLLITLTAAWYIVSPLWAMNALRQAVTSGDTVAIEEMVDFPALREQLRSQAIEKIAREDPSQNGLAAALGAAMIEPYMAVMVTPRTLRERFASSPLDEPGIAAYDSRRIKWNITRYGLHMFRARPRISGPWNTLELVFRRRGIGWQLTGVNGLSEMASRGADAVSAGEDELSFAMPGDDKPDVSQPDTAAGGDEFDFTEQAEGWTRTVKFDPSFKERPDLAYQLRSARIAEMRKDKPDCLSETGDTLDCEETVDFELQHDGAGLVSVKEEGFIYSGGAHGHSLIRDHLFDARTRQRIRFGDLFASWADVRPVLQRAFCQQLQRMRDDVARCPDIQRQAITLHSASLGSTVSEFIVSTRDAELGSYAAGNEQIRVAIPAVAYAQLKAEYRMEFAEPGT